MKICGFLLVLTALSSTGYGFTDMNLNTCAVTNEAGALIVLGTEGSYNDTANLAKEAAFDGDSSTFFDPPKEIANSGGAWCGLEMQTPKICTRVKYRGRASLPMRMKGALIQGANTADFSDAETLHVLNPPSGWNGTSLVDEHCTRPGTVKAWRYFRLYTPNPYTAGSMAATGVAAGNVAELQFWGDDETAAAEVAAPTNSVTFSFAGQINGTANFCIGGKKEAWIYEFERKVQGTSDWTFWTSTYGYVSSNFWMRADGLLGKDVAYRVRVHNPGGTTAWMEQALPANNPLTGTWIGTEGSWATNKNHVGSAAFDGNVTTFYDALYANGNWTGLDLGRARTVTGIRYVPRKEQPSRMGGGCFQVANEVDFSDAVTVHTIETTPEWQINEVPFATPVEGRYVRYVSPANGFCNIAECEFTGARTLSVPTGLKVVRSDITNQFAVLSWTQAASEGLTATVVWRSTAPGGPWTNVVAMLPVTTTVWTNDEAQVGVKYWYRLGSADGEGEDLYLGKPGDERVAFRRGTRIDRDWSDNTTVRAGLTPFEYVKSWSTAGNGAAKLFDGSLSTYADIVAADNKNDTGGLMAGLDFGEEYGLTFARGYPRSGQSGRASYHRVYGSNETSSTDTNGWARMEIAGAFSFSGNVWASVEGKSSRTFRKMWISRPSGNGFCNFAELELYGWRAADVADVLQGPEELVGTSESDGLHLTWLGCAAATGYRVERTVSDSANWTVLATVTEPSYVDPTAYEVHNGLHIYGYRVVALKGEEEGYSDEIRISPYVPGPGTGLTGVYTWPWRRDSYSPVQATFTNLASVINFNWGTNKLISAVAGSSNYVHVTWSGQLVVPYDGVYTFKTSAYNYLTLRIDDQYVVNAWGTYAASTNVSVSLTAGPHPIHIDYAEDTGAASCKLMWGGCLVDEVIPATQFIPAELTDESPWEGCRSFRSTIAGAADLEGEVIRLGATGGDLAQSSNFYTFRWQTVCGNFDCRMHVKIIDKDYGSKALLMARSSLDVNAPFVAPTLMWRGNPGYSYGVKRRMGQGEDILDATTPWTDQFVNDEGELRLVRVDDTFSCYVRASDTAAWTLIEKYAFDPGIFGDEVIIGPAACKQDARATPYFHEVTGFTVTKYASGVLILFR